MISLDKSRIGYVGLPSNFTKNGKIGISSTIDFLKLIKKSIEENISLGINTLCIDVSEFKNPEFFYDLNLDENESNIAKMLEEIHYISKLNKIRFLAIVPRDYFLATQLEETREKTILLLSGVSNLMDSFGQTGRSIIVRIGSAYGNRKVTLGVFADRFKQLPEEISKKISVVNDEKPSLYSVTDLIAGCYYEAGIPVSFKFLNHIFNDGGLSIREALFLSCSTWGFGSNPIMIHSESSENDENGFPLTPLPSNFLSHRIPTFGLSFDILIDSPMKEKSCYEYIKNYKSFPPIVFNKRNRK